jgi:hypothetical protein
MKGASWLFELALVLVRLDQFASRIVNMDHSMRAAVVLRVSDCIADRVCFIISTTDRMAARRKSDRERKIAQFAKDYGLHLTFYTQGMCAIFEEKRPRMISL